MGHPGSIDKHGIMQNGVDLILKATCEDNHIFRKVEIMFEIQ